MVNKSKHSSTYFQSIQFSHSLHSVIYFFMITMFLYWYSYLTVRKCFFFLLNSANILVLKHCQIVFIITIFETKHFAVELNIAWFANYFLFVHNINFTLMTSNWASFFSTKYHFYGMVITSWYECAQIQLNHNACFVFHFSSFRNTKSRKQYVFARKISWLIKNCQLNTCTELRIQ